MGKVRFIDLAGSVRTGTWTTSGIEGPNRTFSPDEVDIIAPVAPEKVIGVGKNYRPNDSSSNAYPDQPRLWWKGGPNVVACPGAEIAIPSHGKIAYGGELGVVIAKECKGVPATNVKQYIAGYTCINDLSDHAYPDDPLMLREKSFDNSAPMGPVVSSVEQVPSNPRIRLWVNGEKQQDSEGEDFIHSVSEVVSTISNIITLNEDDVIMMGSPSDNGYLEDGDKIEIDVESVGRLKHTVVANNGHHNGD